MHLDAISDVQYIEIMPHWRPIRRAFPTLLYFSKLMQINRLRNFRISQPMVDREEFMIILDEFVKSKYNRPPDDQSHPYQT